MPAAIAASLLALAGCSATVEERHYFAAYRDSGAGTREPVQFFRLSVSGQSQFANTRYLTGYFVRPEQPARRAMPPISAVAGMRGR